MKRIVLMGRAKSGKSVLLADYLRNGENSALFANWIEGNDSSVPKLVLDFNDECLLSLIEKNDLNEVDNLVYTASDRDSALKVADAIMKHYERFVLVIDQARVTFSNHEMISIAHDLQRLYDRDMSIVITTSLSTDYEVNRTIYGRLQFMLGIKDILEIEPRDESDCYSDININNLITGKAEKTINIRHLQEKYYTGKGK